MGVRWARLVGDTEKFALRVELYDDPHGGRAAAPEESQSWGKFEIWVRSQNLCAHQSSGIQLDSVHWYLLPLFEWIVANWDPLFHESRLPNSNRRESAESALRVTSFPPVGSDPAASNTWEENWYGWWNRHCIEAGRQGAVFPYICFRRWIDQIEISWGGRAGVDRPPELKFTSGAGFARLDPPEIIDPLFEVLLEVARYLRNQLPNSLRLSNLESAIRGLKETREDRVTWLLGLGRNIDSMRESIAKLRTLTSSLPHELLAHVFPGSEPGKLFLSSPPAALMFGATSPDLSSDDQYRLILALGAAAGESSAPIRDLAREQPLDSDDVSAADLGYDLAENILSELNLHSSDPAPVNVNHMVEALGVHLAEISLDDHSIRGVAIGGRSFLPTILINDAHNANSYPTGRRFTIAHELCHLLVDHAYARDVALPSGPWAPRDVERRANAFAAMLLMPVEKVSAAISDIPTNANPRQYVDAVAEKLHVSFTASLEHLHNLGVIDDVERDMLRQEPYH